MVSNCTLNLFRFSFLIGDHFGIEPLIAYTFSTQSLRLQKSFADAVDYTALYTKLGTFPGRCKTYGKRI